MAEIVNSVLNGEGDLHAYLSLEMLGAMVEEKMGDAIKLYPLAKVQNMEAKAGDTITIPTTKYIGDAEAVAAGEAVNLDQFVQTMANVKVGKVAKGMQFTVEDLNNAYVDLQGETEKQMIKAIANKIEKDLFTVLKTGTLTANIPALDTDGLAEAVVPFGEDIEDAMYLFVNPADLATLRKDDNFIVNANHGDGEIKSAGQIFGMEVVVTNHVDAGAPIILKDEAVAIYLKQGLKIEHDKDIIKQIHFIVATQHYAVALNDDAKVIQVTVGEPVVEPDEPVVDPDTPAEGEGA